MLVPLLKSQKSRDPLSNCLYPISNRTEIAAWFSSQIAIMSCSGTRCQKKYETCAETAALIMKVLSKPNCYQLPTTAMSYNQPLSSLPPSASLADLNLFRALVSNQTSSTVPCSLNDPGRLPFFPAFHRGSLKRWEKMLSEDLHNFDKYLNLLPGGYESGDQTRFHSIFFPSVCASSTFLFWFAGAGGLG